MMKELLISLCAATPLLAQSEPGLRLFSPILQNEVQIVDGQGTVVHSWPGQFNLSVAMTEDGSLLRSVVESIAVFPGSTGRLQKLDIGGNLTWDLVINNSQRLMHHDIELLPNG
ncbi:MAG TPA: hypothetical protein EYP98_15890, partial [Planctomycetes bacterium]|nr:hypothetical protein [Planctomycetota bacterium]